MLIFLLIFSIGAATDHNIYTIYYKSGCPRCYLIGLKSPAKSDTEAIVNGQVFPPSAWTASDRFVFDGVSPLKTTTSILIPLWLL